MLYEVITRGLDRLGIRVDGLEALCQRLQVRTDVIGPISPVHRIFGLCSVPETDPRGT